MEDDHHDDDSDLHRFIANVKVVRQHSSLFKLPQHSPVPSTLGAIEEPAEAAHEAAAAASAEAAAESSSDMVLPLASSSLRACPVVQPLRPSTRAFTRRIGVCVLPIRATVVRFAAPKPSPGRPQGH